MYDGEEVVSDDIEVCNWGDLEGHEVPLALLGPQWACCPTVCHLHQIAAPTIFRVLDRIFAIEFIGYIDFMVTITPWVRYSISNGTYSSNNPSIIHSVIKAVWLVQW